MVSLLAENWHGSAAAGKVDRTESGQEEKEESWGEGSEGRTGGEKLLRAAGGQSGLTQQWAVQGELPDWWDWEMGRQGRVAGAGGKEKWEMKAPVCTVMKN